MESKTIKFPDGTVFKLVNESGGFKVFEPIESVEQRILEFEEMAGVRIQEWVEESLTFYNGCKRHPEQEDYDNFGIEEIGFMFTQKGERLYRSYLSKITRLASQLFPDEEVNIEQHTGIIYS